MTPPPIRYRGREYRSPKVYTHGTHRSRPPHETLASLRGLARACGVTRVAHIDGLDRIGLPVVLGVRPNSWYLSVDSGKGLTREAAEVSALMECLERHRADTVRLDTRTATVRQAAADFRTLDLGTLPPRRAALLDPTRPRRWAAGWDLVADAEVWVPAELVGNARPRHDPREPLDFQGGTNGLASGNDLAEAIASGLYEVVERDAIALAHLAARAGQAPRGVRLDTVADPLCRDAIARIERARCEVLLFDRTSDTAVPAFEAVVRGRDGGTGSAAGYGCHLDPGVALLRALLEAVQGRTIVVAGSRDDIFLPNYRLSRELDGEERRAAEEPWELQPCVRYPNASGSSAEADVAALLARLRVVGLNSAVVIDLTPDGWPVSVVRVIVPGLEGYLLPSHAPGPRGRAVVGGGA